MTTPVNTNNDVQKENDKEYNFEQLRKKLESSEREKQVALAKAAAIEKEIAEASRKKFKEIDPDDEPYDEPYVDERRLNKKLERFEERFSKKVDEVADQRARQMLEKERNAQFLKHNSDFNQVLSTDNIEKFANQHPSIAEEMVELPDNFNRQKLLYQQIKALGINKPPEKTPSIQETIDKNRRGPFYHPTGVGTAPYAGGGDFSATGQKSAYDKMQELKSRLRL
jgi:hypothetical protein